MGLKIDINMEAKHELFMMEKLLWMSFVLSMF